MIGGSCSKGAAISVGDASQIFGVLEDNENRDKTGCKEYHLDRDTGSGASASLVPALTRPPRVSERRLASQRCMYLDDKISLTASLCDSTRQPHRQWPPQVIEACTSGADTIEALAERLTARGISFSLFHSRRSSRGRSLTLPHTCVLIHCGAPDSEPLVADTAFAEQFVIPRPTPRYRAALRSLPRTFVGTLRELDQTVRIMAAHIDASFEEAGMERPPWRSEPAMRARWPRRWEEPSWEERWGGRRGRV